MSKIRDEVIALIRAADAQKDHTLDYVIELVREGKPMDDLTLIVVLGLGLLALDQALGSDVLPSLIGLTPAPPTPGPVPAPGPAPAPAPTPPPTPQPPGGTGGAGGADAIDSNSLAIYNSPDVRGWAVTSRVDSITFGDQGLSIEFSPGKADWPDVIPPGWTGPIRYTVWIARNLGDHWAASGVVQMWDGRPSTDDVPLYGTDQIAANWFYDSRWGELAGWQPQAGETVGIFVTAGDARGADNHAVAERSNIVTLPFPSGPQTFTF